MRKSKKNPSSFFSEGNFIEISYAVLSKKSNTIRVRFTIRIRLSISLPEDKDKKHDEFDITSIVCYHREHPITLGHHNDEVPMNSDVHSIGI